MTIDSLGLLITAFVALGGLAVGIGTFFSTRKKDVGTLAVQERINEFTILEGTIQTLRDSLTMAEEQTAQLRIAVQRCSDETQKLTGQVTIALANVALLNGFIEDHVPVDVPRPKLRRFA